MRSYYVYIMTNASRTLYVGMTSNLKVRVYQHQEKMFPGFKAKYNIKRLVYIETYENVDDAIARERQLKW